MKYTLINDFQKINLKQWNDFVKDDPRGIIFQTPEMYKVYQNTKKYEPVFLAVIDNNENILGTLLAVIQKEYSGFLGNLTARSIIFGGPLIEDNNPEILHFILKEYGKRIKRKAIYSQFRNMWEYSSEEKKIFKKNGFVYDDHLDIIHELNKTDDELLSQMHKGRRKNIRRAIKKNVLFEEIADVKELKLSLELIKETYKKVKLPMPDESFFISVFKIVKKENVKFFKAVYEGKLIAVRFVFTYKNLVYDWFAGADSDNLDKYPNDLFPFRVMQWGRDNGFLSFQFGGAGKPNIHYGVRDYKLKFGGQLVNYGRYEKVHKPILMEIGKIGFKIQGKIKK